MKNIHSLNHSVYTMKHIHYYLKWCLLLLAILPQAVAGQTVSEHTTTLPELRQSYISAANSNAGDGEIILALPSPVESQLTYDEVIGWIERGNLTVEGVQLLTEYTERISHRRVSVPFLFVTEPPNGYLSTYLRINPGQQEEHYGEITLFPGTRTAVAMISTVDKMSVNEAKFLELDSIVTGHLFSDTHQIYLPIYHPIIVPKRPVRDQHESFIHRNRYWLAGAAVLLIGGTTAVILSGSGSSAAILPPPPGRP